jgi:hypothetical protein
MKSAVLPQVRVEPELRAELESVLRQGETLSEFVETSVRNAVEYRRVQNDFHARGEAAWADFQRTGASLSTADVVGELRARVDARRQHLRKR